MLINSLQGITGGGIKASVALARYGLGERLVAIIELPLSADNPAQLLRDWKAFCPLHLSRIPLVVYTLALE